MSKGKRVAIVGRPNVGKSTLFNRLVGRRESITLPSPGITRDLIESICRLDGGSFRVFDTGGLQDPSSDPISGEVTRQVESAIESADLILFLVDAHEGVTPADEEIAARLRRLSCPVLLTVNKVDHPKHQNLSMEFHRLGMEPIITISAEHGLGVWDLADQVLRRLGETHAFDELSDAIRLSVVGRPNVGKSSLLNRILGEHRSIVSEIPGTTRDAVDTLFTHDEQKYLLVDTAGIRRHGKIGRGVESLSVMRARQSLDRGHVALVVMDSFEGITARDIAVCGLADELGCAVIPVLNKVDLIESDLDRRSQLVETLGRRLDFMSHTRPIWVSALTGRGVHRVLPRSREIFAQYTRSFSTSDLNEFLRVIERSRRVRGTGGLRSSLKYLCQTSTAPPSFLIFTSRPETLAASQIRYIKNALRSHFDLQDTPIRLRIRRS